MTGRAFAWVVSGVGCGIVALGAALLAGPTGRPSSGSAAPVEVRHAILEAGRAAYEASLPANGDVGARAAAVAALRAHPSVVESVTDSGDEGVEIDWRGDAPPLFVRFGDDPERPEPAAPITAAGSPASRGVLDSIADLLLPTRTVSAQTVGRNRTPGNGGPGNHLAVVWSPYFWAGDSGEHEFRSHVCEGALSGQRYDDSLAFVERVAPTEAAPGPAACTVSAFDSLLGTFGYFQLGVLFITTTSGRNGASLAIENYHRSPNGLAYLEAAYGNYLENGGYEDEELRLGATRFGYHVAIRRAFLLNRFRAGKAMVFVNGCVSESLLHAFTTPLEGALVALAHADCPTRNEARERVRTFFQRLDGKEGQEARSVNDAQKGLSLVTTGHLATTLAPSVLTFDTPCPMQAGRIIQFVFDTACDVAVTPEVVSRELEFGVVRWRNEFTLEAVCTQPPVPVTSWEARLLHAELKSAANGARLDGNMLPAGTNAEGPAHDDFVLSSACRPPGILER